MEQNYFQSNINEILLLFGVLSHMIIKFLSALNTYKGKFSLRIWLFDKKQMNILYLLISIMFSVALVNMIDMNYKDYIEINQYIRIDYVKGIYFISGLLATGIISQLVKKYTPNS